MMTEPNNQLDIFADVEPKLEGENNSQEMSYEQAVSRLEQIVSKLESGETALDESMTLFQEGMKLAAYCSGKLESMEEQITKLMLQADGSVDEIPLDDKDA